MLRKQIIPTDGKSKARSIACATDFSEDTPRNRSVTKQEFADEANINKLFERYGVMHQQRTTFFGEMDYNIDLQQAIDATDQSKKAYSRMTPEIKQLYPTWKKFVNAMATGDLEKEVARLDQDKHTAAERAEVEKLINRDQMKEELQRRRDADKESTRIMRDGLKPEDKPK